jgi:hypothetical protein
MKTVISELTQFEINDQEYELIKDLIYFCNECQVYHIQDGKFDEVKKLLN